MEIASPSAAQNCDGFEGIARSLIPAKSRKETHLNLRDLPGRVAIIVDSAASVPEEFKESPLTFVAPMRLHVGDKTYRDSVDISPGDFYRRQRGTKDRTSTSAPSPSDFLEAYAAASEVAESALTILVSDAFSAAKRSADTARELFRDIHPEFEIRSVDSRSAAGGQGLIAWEALKESSTGVDLGKVEERAREVRARIRLLAYVDTLYYLWKGGRAPGIAHAGASLLKLKPIFELNQSQIHSLARPRTAQRATEKMIELMSERVGDATVHAIVMHVATFEKAEKLRKSVGERFECAELFLTEFTPVMGAHIGPGMAGVAFWTED